MTSGPASMRKAEIMVATQLDLDYLIQPHRVSGRIYTDPEIFDREMEKIFGATWLYIAHESQVSEPGDYFTTYIGTTPVIVTRTADDGQVRVFYAEKGADAKFRLYQKSLTPEAASQ